MLYFVSYDISADENYATNHTTLTNVIEKFAHIKPTDSSYVAFIPTPSAEEVCQHIEANCGGRIWKRLIVIAVTSPYQGYITKEQHDWLTLQGLKSF